MQRSYIHVTNFFSNNLNEKVISITISMFQMHTIFGLVLTKISQYPMPFNTLLRLSEYVIIFYALQLCILQAYVRFAYNDNIYIFMTLAYLQNKITL